LAPSQNRFFILTSIHLKMRNKIVVVLLLAVLSGCPVYDPQTGLINIHNYSDSAVYVYDTYSDFLPCMPKLELFSNIGGQAFDEINDQATRIFSPHYRINAYSFGGIRVSGSPSKPKLLYRDKKIVIFFIKESTMRTNTWDEICSAQLYEKAMIFSEQELDSMNWSIIYEP
jgi:hypothetical protein